MDKTVVCSEYSTSNGYVPPKKYTLSTDGKTLLVVSFNNEPSGDGKWSVLSRCMQTLAEIFLPYGYPDSVSGDYLAYQFWDTVQAFCSSLVGTLATHAVLTGLGVGSQDATPLAATLTWLAKDGLGMIGRITFVWFRGCDLDNDLKRWRFIADILNDAAFFVDMLSAAVPRFMFTPMVCFSSASRAIVGVAGGATRTALVQHQALRGNAADVSAKDSSQETIVNLSALIVSLLLVPLLEDKFILVWVLYAVLTFFHLYANYRAVKTLRLRTFNDKRMAIVVDHFTKNGLIPDVNYVNSLESVMLVSNPYNCDVRIGVSLAELFDSVEWRVELWAKLQSLFQNEKFVLMTNCSRRKIRVVLSRHAEASDVIFCSYLCRILSTSQHMTTSAKTTPIESEIGALVKVYAEAVRAREHFFTSASASGWNVSEHNLTIAGQYRFEQNTPKTD